MRLRLTEETGHGNASLHHSMPVEKEYGGSKRMHYNVHIEIQMVKYTGCFDSTSYLQAFSAVCGSAGLA
jgi:hypothetical protein